MKDSEQFSTRESSYFAGSFVVTTFMWFVFFGLCLTQLDTTDPFVSNGLRDMGIDVNSSEMHVLAPLVAMRFTTVGGVTVWCLTLVFVALYILCAITKAHTKPQKTLKALRFLVTWFFASQLLAIGISALCFFVARSHPVMNDWFGV